MRCKKCKDKLNIFSLLLLPYGVSLECSKCNSQYYYHRKHNIYDFTFLLVFGIIYVLLYEYFTAMHILIILPLGIFLHRVFRLLFVSVINE